MARKWNPKEEKTYHDELYNLYVVKNKSISEIADILNIKFQTVYLRLKRLNISTCPELKPKYQNRRNDIVIPKKYTADLAEFFGIMFGDGNLTHFQTTITLGTKELSYAQYVKYLMEKIFHTHVKLTIRANGCRDIYIGSVKLTDWLQEEGLVFNKVKSQVGVPNWIFQKSQYMKRFLRGFFDTDGSVCKLRFGIQVSFINYSFPILKSLQLMLKKLEYKPSEVSSHKVYLTRKSDVKKFFSEIKPANQKHQLRFERFNMRRYSSGNEDRL